MGRYLAVKNVTQGRIFAQAGHTGSFVTRIHKASKQRQGIVLECAKVALLN
jgi:hypothetical protein